MRRNRDEEETRKMEVFKFRYILYGIVAIASLFSDEFATIYKFCRKFVVKYFAKIPISRTRELNISIFYAVGNSSLTSDELTWTPETT